LERARLALIRYLKASVDNIEITLRKMEELHLLSRVNSNCPMNKDDKKSVSGAMHTLGGTLINWISKMQEPAATSSCDMEDILLAYGATEMFWG
jgi:hypothetical protein